MEGKPWRRVRLRYLSTTPITNGIGESGQYDNPDWARYVRITDIAGPRTLRDDTFASLPPEVAEQAPLFKGDLLISGVGATYGKSYLRSDDGAPMCYAGYLVKVPRSNEMLPAFLSYWSESAHYWRQVNSRVVQATVQNFSAAKVKNLEVPRPPQDEQVAIVAFLDKHIGLTDSLVTKYQRFIDLTLQRQNLLIREVVTKGLDPTAKMKETPYAWLGDVPAHWELRRVKTLFRLVREAAPTDNDMELLSLYTDIGVRPRRELEERGNKASTTDGYWIVKRGDLVVNKLLAWMGAVAVSGYDGVTSPAYDILRKIASLNPWYYDLLFRCGIYLTAFRMNSRGIMDMRLRLYFEELGTIVVPYPPLSEQNKIIDHARKQKPEYEAVLARCQQHVLALKKYREALITAAVTGEIDVRKYDGRVIMNLA